MEFNLPACEGKLATMARVLGASGSEQSERELAAKAVQRVKGLLAALSVSRRMPWEGVPIEELEEITRLQLDHGRFLNNPRRPTEAEMLALYEKALQGWELVISN